MTTRTAARGPATRTSTPPALPAAGPQRRAVIDCFAGIGGFAHALTDPRFGYELALTIELDADARHVYAHYERHRARPRPRRA